MHVVIVGCGRVGSGLARRLEEAGHTTAVIDKSARAFHRPRENFSGQRIVGFGFDRDKLIEAGIERAGALAAVTNGDNSNIVVARVARENFGVERVVARIYDPRRAAIYERLMIPTVATAQWTTERVLRRVLPSGTSADEWTDPSAKVTVAERPLPSHWAGRTVADLEAKGQRVVALSRLGVADVPDLTLVLQDGDVVWVAVATDAIAELDRRLTDTSTGSAH